MDFLVAKLDYRLGFIQDYCPEEVVTIILVEDSQPQPPMAFQAKGAGPTG